MRGASEGWHFIALQRGEPGVVLSPSLAGLDVPGGSAQLSLLEHGAWHGDPCGPSSTPAQRCYRSSFGTG